jgi:hypothetical protein
LPPTALGFVVATHWDDDHIRGLARVAYAAPDARVVISSSVRSPDFLHLASRHQQRTFSGLAPGTREFARLMDCLTATHRVPVLAQQDTILWRSDRLDFVALSPSASVTLDGLSAAAVRALGAAATGDSVREPTPNQSSIVLALRMQGDGVILGGDLEKGQDDHRGWRAVRRATCSAGLTASGFKVPHHASPDADDEDVWRELLVSDVRFAVTRFNNSERSLPSAADRERLRARSPNGWVLGRPSQRRHEHGVVGRRIRMATRNGVWRATGPLGSAHWRLASSGSAAWTTELDGEAEPV